MSQRSPRTLDGDPVARLADVWAALAGEAATALDATAALAVEALADGRHSLAGAAAGAVVLIEHLEARSYRHAPQMLGVLAATGPASANEGPHGLLAWAGAAVAHDYGVLPSWPRADVAMLAERALTAPADIALALACALGEVCERNGQDADFAELQAQIAAVEAGAGGAPYWRGYWAITTAWHMSAFGKRDLAVQQLETAQALAEAHGLDALGANAGLQRARIVEWRRDPARALALADEAVRRGDAARAPLWWADQADIRCRIALRGLDFHAALGHARRASGFLKAASVWPGYAVTYRVNEAYALIGTGSFDEALACFAALNETPMPRFLAARLKCLADLALVSAADQADDWSATSRAGLEDVLRRLRELEWPSVLGVLPQHIARLFMRALLEGIEPDWVRAAIRARKLAAPPGAPASWPWAVTVRTLGPFQVGTEAGPLHDGEREPRKASSKPLELLRFLAAHGHDAVLIDSAAEALWPGDGREGRQKAFDVTVARLRRLLDSDVAVGISDRRVRLNPQWVWIDAAALAGHLSDGERAGEGSAAVATALEAALALYRGPCLADSRESWALVARERVRARLAALLLRASRSSASPASERDEWALRATAADPDIAPLIGARDQSGRASTTAIER